MKNMGAQQRVVVALLVICLILTGVNANVKCFNKSEKPVQFVGTNLIGAKVDVAAKATVMLKLLVVAEDLLCTVKNEATGLVSIALTLLSGNYVACVDVGAKVVLYNADSAGNTIGEPLCDPF